MDELMDYLFDRKPVPAPIQEITVTRDELIDAFTFWMIEAEHKDFRPINPTPEEYGVQAADHLLRLLRLERTG